MKLAFVNRRSADAVVGGDTIQMNATADGLRKLGCEVARVSSPEEVSSDVDLIHFFNIIRPQEILPFLKLNQPKVVSTIYVDYSEFDQKNRTGLQRLLAKGMGKNGTEYLKALVRHFKNREHIQSKSYLLKGHRRAIQKVLNEVDYLLPNSHSEYKRLAADFKLDVPYERIPNAIDPSLFQNKGGSDRKGLLCVGRIEGIKNQLNLILALQGMDVEATIVGRAAPNHHAYMDACKAAAGPNVRFKDFMPQQELVELYQKAKVHALPSWFETTGLTSLEAAACGCIPVVSLKGDVMEYFSNIAEFCDPESIDSIRQAINTAMARDNHKEVSNYVHDNFTWKFAAERSYSVYSKLL